MRCAAGHKCRPAQHPAAVRQLSESSAALWHAAAWLQEPMPCLVVLQWQELSCSDGYKFHFETFRKIIGHAMRRKQQMWSLGVTMTVYSIQPELLQLEAHHAQLQKDPKNFIVLTSGILQVQRRSLNGN